LRGAARGAEAAIAAHARHALLAALTFGLLLARHPAALLLLPLAAPRRPLLALALLAAGFGGVVGAGARMAQLDRTALRPLFGHSLAGRATLLDAPQPTPFGWRATVSFRDERIAVSAGRWVRQPVAPIGARLFVAGTLKPLTPAQAWMRARNVHAALSARAVRVLGGPDGVVDRVRARADRALLVGAPARVSGLLRGMVLGEGEALDPSLQEDFRKASLTHLVAASGQNVALLAALAVALATALGLGLRGRLLCALALVVLYVPLAGAGPSIQRAGIMGGAALVAALAGRPGSRAYALLLAAALTLLVNPRASSDPGWQMSFAAVIGIAVAAGPIGRRLRGRGVPAAVAEATGMTVAATLVTAPLIALHFDRVSLVGLPANVLAAPAVAPAMWLGAIAAAIGQVSTALAGPLATLAAIPTAYVAWLGHTAARLPGAAVQLSPVAVTVACALVALSPFAARRVPAPTRRVAVAIALAVALAAAGPLRLSPPGPPPALRISFLDVGQGDATLIQAGGYAVLVDAGPPGDHIASLVRREGARRVDLLVITHAQADHEGGGPDVMAQLSVGAVLDGRDGVPSLDGTRIAAAAVAHRAPLLRPAAGQVLRIGPIRLDVLSPPETGRLPGEDPNARAVVLAATVAGVRLLLTADAESDVLSSLPLEPVDLLKVSHHGSADPGLPSLLSILRPRAAVIEVGRHNPYGHPARSTLAALATVPRVLRTDRDGTVRAELRSGRLIISTLP
jgi:competence protein ComEC